MNIYSRLHITENQKYTKNTEQNHHDDYVIYPFNIFKTGELLSFKTVVSKQYINMLELH